MIWVNYKHPDATGRKTANRRKQVFRKQFVVQHSGLQDVGCGFRASWRFGGGGAPATVAPRAVRGLQRHLVHRLALELGVQVVITKLVELRYEVSALQHFPPQAGRAGAGLEQCGDERRTAMGAVPVGLLDGHPALVVQDGAEGAVGLLGPGVAAAALQHAGLRLDDLQGESITG